MKRKITLNAYGGRGIVILPVLAAIMMIAMVIIANYQILSSQMRFQSKVEADLELTHQTSNVNYALKAAANTLLADAANPTGSGDTLTASAAFTTATKDADGFFHAIIASDDVRLDDFTRLSTDSWKYKPFEPTSSWGSSAGWFPASLGNHPLKNVFAGSIYAPTSTLSGSAFWTTESRPLTLGYDLEEISSEQKWSDEISYSIYEFAAGAVGLTVFGNFDNTPVTHALPVAFATPAANQTPMNAFILGNLTQPAAATGVNFNNVGNVVVAGKITGTLPAAVTSYSEDNMPWGVNSFSYAATSPSDFLNAASGSFVSQSYRTRQALSAVDAELTASANNYVQGNDKRKRLPSSTVQSTGQGSRLDSSHPSGSIDFIDFRTVNQYRALRGAKHINLNELVYSPTTLWYMDYPTDHVAVELPTKGTGALNTTPLVVACRAQKLTIILASPQARPVYLITDASNIRLLSPAWTPGTTGIPSGAASGNVRFWGRLGLLDDSATFNDLTKFRVESVETGENWASRSLILTHGLMLRGRGSYPLIRGDMGPQSIILGEGNSLEPLSNTNSMANYAERVIYVEAQ